MKPLFPILLVIALSGIPLASPAQDAEAGRATSVSGVVSVQRATGAMGIMARGSAVRAGDTVLTQPDSRAVIELRDGAKLTLRPSSEFRIEGYRFAQAAPQEDSTVLRLLKGGLRTLTGLLGQRRPTAFQLNTGTATIGIRGTDFTTRICEDDCAAEARKEITTAVARTPGYVGRLIALQGRVATLSGPRAGKPLAVGDPVYAEDVLETSRQGFGILVFQDGTRIVLQENTRFAVERYKYEPSRPDQGNVVFRLLKGGLRALTGLVARSNNRQFQVNTAVATIGVRGTGFDLMCTGPCAEDGEAGAPDVPPGLTGGNWQGCAVARNEFGEEQFCEGEAVQVASDAEAPRRLTPMPAFFDRSQAPRPDKLKVNLEELFGLQQEGFAEPGVYVQVRDGTVTLKGSGTENFTLAKGETGYVSPNGTKFVRLGVTPVFMDRDIFIRDGDPGDYGCFMR